MEALAIVLETVERLNRQVIATKKYGEKTCARCGQTKPVTEFFRSKSRYDGFSCECKDCLKDNVLRWKGNNPDRMRDMWAKDKRQRRAALKVSTPYLSTKEFAGLVEAFGGSCAYCGSTKELFQDHFYPIGADYADNAILPACAKCNSSKGNNDFKEWYPEQIFYDGDREKRIYRFLFAN